MYGLNLPYVSDGRLQTQINRLQSGFGRLQSALFVPPETARYSHQVGTRTKHNLINNTQPTMFFHHFLVGVFMKTGNFFRSALSALAIAIFGIIAFGSNTEANAQCLAPANVALVPAPGAGPCCFLVRVQFNAAGNYTWVRVTKAGSVVGGAPNAGFTNAALALPNSVTFTPTAVPFFPGAGWHTLGMVCFNAGGMVTITTNGACPPINIWVNCNGPIGGGNPPGGGGGIVVNNPDGNIDVNINLGKSTADDNTMESTVAQNFIISPNPATTTSTVRFSTTQVTNNVTLSITDITGREVMRVLDGATLGKGNQEIPVSMEALTAGMYQVTLRAEGALLFNSTMSVVR